MQSPAAVAAFASVLSPTVPLAEKGFEICAVDERAKGLLQTVQQVAGRLDDARTLRRQKSGLFTDFEKRMFEDTFRHCEEAIRHVASLAERPRADMEVSGGRLRMNTRLVFVLRDSPGITVSLTQLGVANESLGNAIVTLSSRPGRPTSGSMSSMSNSTQSPGQGEWKPPPTYEESQFLSAGRRRNMQRRASAMAALNPSPPERPRALSSTSGYLPVTPSIPELMGDETFVRPAHQSLPIIRVASAPHAPSEPIVIEAEPEAGQTVPFSPPRSPSALSQSTNSPPRSPPVRRRLSSVSSPTNSDGVPPSTTFTPPQSAGVRTPPNGRMPQFQDPRPPPMNYVPPQHIVMPMPPDGSQPPPRPPYPTNYSSSQNISMPSQPPGSLNAPYPNAHPPPTNIPPLPQHNLGYRTAPNSSWAPQQFHNYRPTPGNLEPAPNLGISTRPSMDSMPSNPSVVRPHSPNYPQATNIEDGPEPDYVYTPSLARKGQGGRHRSHAWLEARAQ